MSNEVRYETTWENVDWQEMKSTLAADCFDNGRTPRQLRESFKNSYATVIAYAEERMIGTARVLSERYILRFCKLLFVDCMILGRILKSVDMGFPNSRSLDNSNHLCFLSSNLIQLLDSKSNFLRLVMWSSIFPDQFQKAVLSSRYGSYQRLGGRSGMSLSHCN